MFIAIEAELEWFIYVQRDYPPHCGGVKAILFVHKIWLNEWIGYGHKVNGIRRAQRCANRLHHLIPFHCLFAVAIVSLKRTAKIAYTDTQRNVCVECCMFNSNYFNWSARNAKWKFVPFFVDDFSGLPFIVDELTSYFWPIGKYDTTRYYAISCDIFAMDGNGSGTPRPTCAAIGCDYFWPAFAECKNKSCILSAFNRTGNQLRMRKPTRKK